MTNRYDMPMADADWSDFVSTITFIEPDTANSTVSGSLTIPATLTWKGPAPLEGTTPTFTVGGVARTVVESTTPASGQIGINRLTGQWYFHSSDSGGTLAYSNYTPFATWIPAAFLKRLQERLVYLEEGHARLRNGLTIPISIQTNATTAVSSVIAEVFLPGGLTSFELTGVTIVAPAYYGNGSQAGASNVEICVDGTFTTKKTASIGASATIARTDVSSSPLVLDDTGGDQFYLRFAASPGQHWITNVILEGRLKDES